MSKGVTPVVATVLLITITVGAAGTLYATVQSTQDNTRDQVSSDLGLNTDQLRVEQCYNQSSSTYLVIRNNGQDAINSSDITPLLNLTVEENYDAGPEIVNPQRTFTIEFFDQFGSETQIRLTAGDGSPIEHRCIGL